MIARTCLICHTVLLLAIGQPAHAGDLILSADRPTVSVETRSDGRNFIRLPALRFMVRIRTACSDARKPARVTLSVADTRVVLNEDEVVTSAEIDVPVLVPSSQIGPVAVEGFCLTDDAGGTGGEERMTVPSVLSIQASLLCTGDSGDEIDYASTALNVMLECTRPQETEPD